MTIFGSGGDGFLRMLPEVVDFDIVKVDFNKKVYATLENVSDCTFYVELYLKPKSEQVILLLII